MEEHKNIIAYRDIERKRLEVLIRLLGEDSDEEDDLLCQADTVWWQLTDEEPNYLNAVHGPSHKETCQILDGMLKGKG